MKKILFILILSIIYFYIQGEEKSDRIFIPDFKLIDQTDIPNKI